MEQNSSGRSGGKFRGRWVFEERSQVFLAGVGEAWQETGWEDKP